MLDRAAIESYLVDLLADSAFAEAGDAAWAGVFHALLDLYPQAHTAFLREWVQAGYSNWMEGSEADLDRLFAQERGAALARSRRKVEKRFPKDVHGYLAHWAGMQPGFWDEATTELDPFDDEALIDMPAHSSEDGTEPIRATKPKVQDADKKKKKRKLQQKGRKANRTKK